MLAGLPAAIACDRADVRLAVEVRLRHLFARSQSAGRPPRCASRCRAAAPGSPPCAPQSPHSQFSSTSTPILPPAWMYVPTAPSLVDGSPSSPPTPCRACAAPRTPAPCRPWPLPAPSCSRPSARPTCSRSSFTCFASIFTAVSVVICFPSHLSTRILKCILRAPCFSSDFDRSDAPSHTQKERGAHRRPPRSRLDEMWNPMRRLRCAGSGSGSSSVAATGALRILPPSTAARSTLSSSASRSSSDAAARPADSCTVAGSNSPSSPTYSGETSAG